MTRYRRRGGFCRLTTLPGALSLARILLLAAAWVCIPFCPAAAAAALVSSLLAALAAGCLIRRWDLGDAAGRALHILADGLTWLILLAISTLKWTKLRFSACVLLALGLLNCIRRLKRAWHPAF